MAAAVAAMTEACNIYERDFSVETGTTPVEFVNAVDTISLASEYINIPIRLTQKSSEPSKAIVALTAGEAVMPDGSRIAIQENNQIVITSNEIFVGPWTDEDGRESPVSYVEVKVPDYREYLSLSLSFAIKGEYQGANVQASIVALRPERVQITGQYMVDPSFVLADGSTADPYTFTIVQDNEDENKYWFTNLEGANTTRRSLYGVLDMNVMTIPPEQENLVIPPVAGGVVTVGICPEGQIDNGTPELEFTDEGIIFRNGFWAGEIIGTSASAYSFIAAGDVAVRMQRN